MTTPDSRRAAPLSKKAIPPGRDRLQSTLLSLIGFPVLCAIACGAVGHGVSFGRPGIVYLIVAAAVSSVFGLAAWQLGAATSGAAVSGGLICFDLTVLTGIPTRGSVFHSALTPLVLLFVLTHAATRVRRRHGAVPASQEERQGRNAAQVIANLGMAAVASVIHCWWFRRFPHTANANTELSALLVWPVVALAEATADTVSSEIGQALGGAPRLVTTFRRVTPGTDGGITLAGTAAGVLSATMVVLVAIPSVGLQRYDAFIALLAAIAGLMFDSVLGATLERRGWIGNDLVNFASTAFAVAVYQCVRCLAVR